MLVTLKVKRFDPEKDAEARYQEYRVDVPETAAVLDALIHLREDVDETLALRCSCRSAICGSCAMRINGQARLACKTKVKHMVEASGDTITIEPAGNMPVIKDLITDFDVFFDKIRAVDPYLQPSDPDPERERIASNESMLEVMTAMACIMCGACVSDCQALEVDRNYLGPAALAKSWRFVKDPRDGAHEVRLQELSGEHGIWDCTHCFACVEVCPKGVAPMERIMELRAEAGQAGIRNNNGYRHEQAFVDSIKKSGWLDETYVAKASLSGVGEMLQWAPVAWRSFAKGKMPLGHKPNPGAENIRKIFEKVGESA